MSASLEASPKPLVAVGSVRAPAGGGRPRRATTPPGGGGSRSRRAGPARRPQEAPPPSFPRPALLAMNLCFALLADHLAGDLRQIADHRLHVMPDVPDLGELRRLDF